MSAPGAKHAVDDREQLLRRIPVAMEQCDDDGVSPEAFQPHRESDVSGLSLFRRSHLTPKQCAELGQSKRGYFIAVLNAGELRAAGIEVEADDPDDPAHLSLPQLRSDNRKQNEALEMMEKLSRLVQAVEGPCVRDLDVT
jgi:hypothetical protein